MLSDQCREDLKTLMVSLLSGEGPEDNPADDEEREEDDDQFDENHDPASLPWPRR